MQNRIYSDERLFNKGIIHGMTNAAFGDMKPPEAREAFYKGLFLPAANMLSFKQTHSADIAEVHTDADFEKYKNNITEADAWLITRAGTGAGILTADCAPLFLWDEGGKAAALVHAGWRGVVAGLPEKAAHALKKYAKGKLYAYVAPHIQDCCFEVSSEDARLFSKEALREREGRFFVDLNAEITAGLGREGVTPEDIKLTTCVCNCTCSDKEEFFSYRRDKTDKRMLSFIYRP